LKPFSPVGLSKSLIFASKLVLLSIGRGSMIAVCADVAVLFCFIVAWRVALGSLPKRVPCMNHSEIQSNFCFPALVLSDDGTALIGFRCRLRVTLPTLFAYFVSTHLTLSHSFSSCFPKTLSDSAPVLPTTLTK
jgi:hypothetical protein